MTKALIIIFFVFSMVIPVGAQELTAPEVFPSGATYMPEKTDSFGTAMAELLRKGFSFLYSQINEVVRVNIGILLVAMLLSILSILTEKNNSAVSVVGAITVASMLFQNTEIMIRYATNMLRDICEYGRLLCPVLTTALAAQGGVTSSAALYSGTILFVGVLNDLVSKFLIPMVYIFLLFAVANAAVEDDVLKNIAMSIKRILSWILKTLLIVFTTYMSLTGVVSGTTDAAALKTVKLTISSVVPVVGSILSDASESLLVSMGFIKNAAGIYGILAVLAIFIEPFLKVSMQYLFLKGSGILCGILGNKKIEALVDDFSSAMGLLVAMTATGCAMILVSIVCFLKGIGS